MNGSVYSDSRTASLVQLCEETLQDVIAELHLRREAVVVPPRRDIVIEWRNENLTLFLSVAGVVPYLDVLMESSSEHISHFDLSGYLWSRMDGTQKRNAAKMKSLRSVLECMAEQMLAVGIPAIRMLELTVGLMAESDEKEAAEDRRDMTT